MGRTSSKVFPRAVPLRLVFKGRAWYLQAYCLERRAYRTFKLTRVLELEVLEKRPIEYRCDCSRERMERALISLGREELRDMIDQQGGAELTCRFCDRVEHFSREDLEALLAGC